MASDKRLEDIIGALGNHPPKPASLYEMGSIFGSPAPASTSPPNGYEALVRALGSATLPVPRPPAVPVVRPQLRMTYFAFDFDDLMRVNNVRMNGKIGPRVMKNSRGFLDRSVWEASKAYTDRGLRLMMQQVSSRSSVVCVLIGSNTWMSRWVRYEIALSVINERGLVAMDLNGINHSDQTGPDPLGAHPLSFIGLHKTETGVWRLVEKKPFDQENGEVALLWDWYEDHKAPVEKPQYIPDIPAGGVVPLSLYTKRYDFMGHVGSANIGAWLHNAAIEAER
jgi:hypothetical protein